MGGADGSEDGSVVVVFGLEPGVVMTPVAAIVVVFEMVVVVVTDETPTPGVVEGLVAVMAGSEVDRVTEAELVGVGAEADALRLLGFGVVVIAPGSGGPGEDAIVTR